MSKKLSLKEKIKAASDLVKEEVHVPEWDCTVFVRTMTSCERDSWEEQTYSFAPDDENPGENKLVTNKENIRARLLVRVLLDEDGKRIFNDDEVGDLGDKSIKVIERLYAVAKKVNSVSDSDVEELAKN